MLQLSFKTLAALSLGIALSGFVYSPAEARDQRTTEMYYIFDIKTDASHEVIANAIVKGLKKNAPDMQTSSPLVMGKPPLEPKRFEIVDMADQFKDSPMAGIMQMAQMQGGGLALKQAKCDGAVWIGRFTRDISNQNLNITTCLFPYQGGYSLNLYGQDTHKKGHGLISRNLAASLVEGVLGKPQKWTQKTVRRMRAKIYEHTGVVASLVEGSPKIDFSFDDEPVPVEAAVTQAPNAAIISAPVSTPGTESAPIASEPVQVPAPAVASIDCTGLSDDACMAKLTGAAE